MTAGRVLVLGGTGFLGGHVVRALVERGQTVCLFHRGVTEAEPADAVRHVHGEFASFAEHVPELRAFRPQVVVDVVPFHAKAGHGVTHFADVAERAVVVTSGDVYRAFARVWGSEPGPPDPVPLTEDSPLRERPSPDLGVEIDFDNLDVERAVAALSGLPTTVLRMSVLFGPHDPFHRLFRYVKRMDDRRPAIVLDERLAAWRWSRTYVANAGLAVALAATIPRAAGRTYNVAPLHTVTEREWIEQIGAVHGWKGDVVAVRPARVPEHLRVPFHLDQHVVLDSTRIREELGYAEPVPLDGALRATIEWERRNPPAEVSNAAFDYEAEDALVL